MKQKVYSLAIGLIELLLVIALVAVMVLVSVRYYSSASASQKVSAAVNMFAEVKSAVENYSLNNNNTITDTSGNTVTIATLVAQGYLPQAYALGSGSSAQQQASLHSNPYYGTVNISQTSSGLLELAMTNVPNSDCASIVNQLQSTLNSKLGESATADCSGDSSSGTGSSPSDGTSGVGTVTVDYVY